MTIAIPLGRMTSVGNRQMMEIFCADPSRDSDEIPPPDLHADNAEGATLAGAGGQAADSGLGLGDA